MSATACLPGFPESMPEPQNFFHGVEARRPRANNLIAFLRTNRDNLKQLNFANRSHYRHVLLLVLETPGSVIVDGAEHLLEPGQAFYVRPFQFHYYQNLAAQQLRWTFMTFDLEEGADALNALTHRILKPDAADLDLWRSIFQRYRQGDHGLQAESLPILDQLLYRLSLRYRDRDPQLHATKESWIAQTESIVMESVQKGWTIDEVARKIGLSGRHLRSRFRAEIGVSLREYRANVQLQGACRLLRAPHTSLGQVAELCGFNSQAVFTRFIKRQTGLTPLALRQKLRTNSHDAPLDASSAESVGQSSGCGIESLLLPQSDAG